MSDELTRVKRELLRARLAEAGRQAGIPAERLESFAKTVESEFELNERFQLSPRHSGMTPVRYIAETVRAQHAYFFEEETTARKKAGGASSKVKKRAEFDSMSPTEKNEFVRAGGQVVD
jgi:hypothetical protein